MAGRRKPSGSSRRRRDDEDEVSDDDSTSDSDSVGSSEYSAETEAEEDEEGFAADENDAPAPVHAVAPPPAALPVLNRPGKKGRGRRSKKERGPPLPWEEWEEANEKWISERMAAGGYAEDLEPDAAAAGTVPTAEPAPEVLLPLLPFQKEWLAWALAQEASASRGGILGDEMGMGKTIQAISLVLTARQLRPPSQQASSSSSSPATPKVGCTLVVCPVVAAIQWAQEIERRTAQGSVRVLVYHGPRRWANQIDFHSYDFVITTYHTIEVDYRKITSPKIPCPYCDELIHPRRMNLHFDICGPGRAVGTEKQAKRQRKKLGSSKVKGKRRGHKKADGGEKGDCEELGDELRSQSRDQSPLHLVRWERVILDEAQCIKDRRSNTVKAVFALESEYKWALSGTPLLNHVQEFYSLIRFLQIYPYSNYFCKDCACETLDTPIKKDCDCGHSSVRHFCWWKKYILKPLDYGSATYEGQEAMILLKEKVIKGILLRRRKIDRAADLAMPPIIVTVRLDSFDKNEMEFYEALYAQSCTKFDS